MVLFIFENRKNRRGPCPVNIMAEAVLQCCFLTKIHKQVVKCKLVHCCGAIFMSYFFTILIVFFGLFHMNGVKLLCNTSYDLGIRIRSGLYCYNRKTTVRRTLTFDRFFFGLGSLGRGKRGSSRCVLASNY